MAMAGADDGDETEGGDERRRQRHRRLGRSFEDDDGRRRRRTTRFRRRRLHHAAFRFRLSGDVGDVGAAMRQVLASSVDAVFRRRRRHRRSRSEQTAPQLRRHHDGVAGGQGQGQAKRRPCR